MNNINEMRSICHDCPYWEVKTIEEKIIDTITLMLVAEGQSDPKFKLDEPIKYSPSEVRNILLKHKDELVTQDIQDRYYDYKTWKVEGYNSPYCQNCANNPRNGGSGFCNCILGTQVVY